MARRNSNRKARVQLSPEQKKQRRKIRAQLRREAADSGLGRVASETSGRTTSVVERTPQREEQFWAGTKDRLAAMKILNDHRDRPYWMSIPVREGVAPVAGYFPCTTFVRDRRWYYGFLFREHRDKWFDKMRPRGGRKEITE